MQTNDIRPPVNKFLTPFKHRLAMSILLRAYSSSTRLHPGRAIGLAACLLAAITTLGFLAWIGWSGVKLREEMRLETRRAIRVAELRGSISSLDDSLTMSARMAAESGQSRWVDRYNEAVPLLNAAIAEAVSLATPATAAELAQSTEEANQDLLRMERASMIRSIAGDHGGAVALLDSPEFEYLQATYASGMETFSQELAALAAQRTMKLDDNAWREIYGLVVAAVLLLAATFGSLAHARVRVALARTATVARTDFLTGLANRRQLYEVLHATLAKPQRGDDGVAFLLLDLDRFKLINDLHGHAVGDRLLQLVTTRLQAVARPADLIARLGGDEFALLLRFAGTGLPGTPHDTSSLMARRIITALEQPFELGGGIVTQIGISIGLTLAQCDGDDADALVHRADVALYQAKSAGRGCFRFFESGMDAASRERARLEGELRQAIAADLIIPNFQPMVAITTGRLIGFEMLARWPHPNRGMVPPGDFVPIAEEIGLIGAMTDRLLRRACHIAVTWPAEISLACNISPLQLRDRELPAMIRAALDDTGLAAHRLELEITESALVGDIEMAQNVLQELKELGVRLALDDFGTGYSSLRHLQMLPFDTLKIDASFVNAMSVDEESRKIVAAVIGLGQSLGLSIVAEGIEGPETAALLRNLSCDVGQGWLFGRPCSPDAASALLLEEVNT